jgi:hypothetical protein
MTIVTAEIADITGRPDNTRWEFLTPVRVREGSVEGSIITDRVRLVQPLDGSIRVELDPGPATIKYDGNVWEVTIPEEDSSLWDIISAAVAVPPDTALALIGSAVSSWLQENPPSGDIEVDNISDAGEPGKAALLAETQAGAREAIGAGTSSLAIGTSGSTAKAGNWVPAAADVSDSTSTGRAVLTGDAAAGRTALGAASTADVSASGAMRNLMSKLTEGVSDAAIVMNSDSTGATSDSWLLQTAQWLAARFPAYTVNYYLWDEAGNQWPASPTWTDSGTGAYTLNVWNAGVGGSTTGYFQGSRFPNLVKNADLIIVNHGFNQGGPLNSDTLRQYRRNVYLAFVDEFAAANPNAGVVLIGQPPSGVAGREEWQAQKNLQFAKAAAWRGWGFLNVHRAWIEYGNWQADLTLGDQTHPTAAGLALWASLLQEAMENAGRVSVTTQPTLGGAAAQVFKNPQLSAWSGSLPDGVTSATNCTLSKELTDFETGTHAMKITSTSTSGFAWIELTGTAEQWGIKGRLADNTYTAAVRLKVPAANTGTVRVGLLDNNGTGGQMNTDVASSPDARDRYIWVYATKAFPSNATSLTMWIFVRTSGTAIVDVLVDEIRLCPGPCPQPGISGRDTLGALPAAEGDFAQHVGGVWVPRTPAQVRTALDLDAEVLTNAQACLPVGSMNSAITMTSGTIVFGYFVAEQDVTIANLAASSSSTAAAATPTLIRMGVYSCDASGNLALLAGTTNDTSLFAAIGTEYSKALDTPVALTKGTRYAYGLLIVSGTTMPTIMAQAAVGAQGVFARATSKRPRRSSALAGQTDLPASVSSGAVATKNGVPFIIGTT